MERQSLMSPGSPAVVVYIAGYGRSGSTILDSAIAACVGGFGSGEVNRIFESMTESQYCEKRLDVIARPDNVATAQLRRRNNFVCEDRNLLY